MPGFEVFGKDERDAINKLFDLNGGILFAHGFDSMRKGIYRVREFEKAFAIRFGIPYAQAVSSGSTALKIGLQSLGIGKGDEVITQSHTFVATVEAIREVGAKPIIVDVDESLTMCPESFEDAVTGKTKAVIPVHMLGAPCDMDQIMKIARKYNIKVLEDNAQSCGASYNGKLLGAIGDVGSFSFDFGKTITTGEGGMVIMSDRNLYIRARGYHDHGHEYNHDIPERGDEDFVVIGFNYRMNELQGVIGLVQLSKLDMIIEKQRANKKKMLERLKYLPFQLRKIHDPCGETGKGIFFLLDRKDFTKKFTEKANAMGLPVDTPPIGIKWHFARYWNHIARDFGEDWSRCWKKSADILDRTIGIAVMVNMTDNQIDEICENLIKLSREFI